jgi:hypothetical protein
MPEEIWKRPAWIAAIVSLISVFLTVPEVIGNYLTKQQDIELAKEETATVRLGNIESKQDQEFKIVNSTLSQQGTERIFLIRYLAATLDDPDAKEWAKKEAERLDELASKEEALSSAKRTLKIKQEELDSFVLAGRDATYLVEELDKLKYQLYEKDSQFQELQQKAGLKEKAVESYNIIIRTNIKWPKSVVNASDPDNALVNVAISNSAKGESPTRVFSCWFDTSDCLEVINMHSIPNVLYFRTDLSIPAPVIESIEVFALQKEQHFGRSLSGTNIPYKCSDVVGGLLCHRVKP